MHVETAKRYLRYDPDTGHLYWIKDTNPRGPSKIGFRAGVINSLGYIAIGLLRQRLYGHHLAWLLTYGYIPKYMDHIDGDPSNNRLCNLRESTQSQNIANADYGYARGIELHGNRFRVRFRVRGKRVEIGSFMTFEQARIARDAAYNEHFGEYSYFRRD